MRVLVVGAGAVGSFLGWAAAAGGGAVALVRRGRAAASGAPLTVVRPDGSRHTVEVEVAPSAAGVQQAPELVVLAVRQYDVSDALASLAGLPGVPVLTAQNGIGAEEAALAARGGAPVVAGSVTASVERLADGSVRWLRKGGVALAVVQGDADAVLAGFGAMLRAAAVPVAVLPDHRAMKWSKLVGNLVGNATSGLLDMDVGAIYAHPRLFDVERRQVLEALAVMRSMNLAVVRLPGGNVPLLARAVALPAPLARFALRRAVGGARGGKDPSLRAAVDAGGRTEVDWLNGAVARAGADLGVATPVNDSLTALVRAAAADPGRRAWFRQRPDRLVEALSGTGRDGG